jgi:hypothetical protein
MIDVLSKCFDEPNETLEEIVVKFALAISVNMYNK